MQRKEKTSNQSIEKTINEIIRTQKLKTRVTSLAPYIAEI